MLNNNSNRSEFLLHESTQLAMSVEIASLKKKLYKNKICKSDYNKLLINIITQASTLEYNIQKCK